MGAFVRVAIFALALLFNPVGATPVQAEAQRLDRDEARSYAIHLLRVGQPKAARAIAFGLLQADSRDVSALVIMARAENALGRHHQGAASARRAWKYATSEGEKFTAAYVISQSLAGQERYGLAQWWLRRAGQASDTPQLDRAAKREYAKVRSQNPWSLRFGVSVKPSSNINGGPSSNTFSIGDIVFVDPTAVPLSGLQFGTSASIRRDFRPKNGRNDPVYFIGLNIDDRRYSLSESALANVPSARGSDYTYSEIGMLGGIIIPDKNGSARTILDLAVDKNWYGSDPLSTTFRLRGRHDVFLSRGKSAGVSLSFEKQNRDDISARSADIVSVGSYWQNRTNKGTIYVALDFSDTNSASSEIAHNAASISVHYRLGKKIAGAAPSLNVSLIGREYDNARYGNEPRRDAKTVIGADFWFQDLDYYGFAPTIGVNYARNASNVTLFDYEEFGITFGFRSTF